MSMGKVKAGENINMKIYLASSWKNKPYVCQWAKKLRFFKFEVDAFCDEECKDRIVYEISKIKGSENTNIKDFMLHGEVQKAFAENKKWLDWCDVLILLLPAGKSSHLEAGYAAGTGKKVVIYSEKFILGEYDVMYGFADLITDDLGDVITFLYRERRK